MKGHRKKSNKRSTYNNNSKSHLKGDKNMKRFAALLLALTLIFGTMSFAMAAPSDVAGTDYEKAVSRLGGLNILVGYPDGTFKPDNSITRAEFATIAVRLLGLENAAQYAKGATDFSDLSAEHWASGYVNIAVNKGVIVGYPDGTFKPENNVTYAEAVTMLVRVLGYGPAADDEGTWPANYIAKGAELGVTEDVTFTAGTPAIRGNIAIMADNSLEIPMMVRVGYGDEATYEVKDDQTLLSEKIKSDTVTVKLVKTHLVDADALEADELAVLEADSDGDYTVDADYEIADGIDADFEAFLGEEVTLWLNDDDEVFFVERETDAKDLVEGVIDAIDAGEITVVDADGDDTDYDLADTVTAYINLQDGYDDSDLEAGMYVKAILNADDEVETVVAVDWSVGVVDSVDTDDEEIEFKYVNASGFEDNDGDLALEDMEYTLDLDGLEEDTVVYWYSVLTDTDDDVYKFFFETFDKSEVGELEEYKDEDYIVVDDEEYDLAYGLVGDYDFEDITDLLGDDVKVFFGKDDKVVMIDLDQAADEEKDYALVTDVTLDTDKYGNETPYIKLLTASGEIIEYEVSDEAVITDGTNTVDRDDDDTVAYASNTLTFGGLIDIVENVKEFGAGADNSDENTLVKFALDKDGKIDELEVMGAVVTAEADKDNDRMGTSLFVEADTLIFDAYNEEVIAFNELEDGYDYEIKYVDDTADIEVMVVYSDNFVEESDYAVYISKSNIADGEYKVKVMTDGEVQYFNTDMGSDVSVFDGAYKGQVFNVDFSDGKISDAVLVTADADHINGMVDSVSTSKNRIEIDGTYYLFAEDVQVYTYELKSDGTVDTVEAGNVRDLDDGQEVNVILDDDGYAAQIFIIDDDNDVDVVPDIKF